MSKFSYLHITTPKCSLGHTEVDDDIPTNSGFYSVAPVSSKVPEVSGYIQSISPVKKATRSQTKYY